MKEVAKRELVEIFFERLETEITYGEWKRIQGFLVFGSYTRNGDFKDIDVVGIIGDCSGNLEKLRDESLGETARLKNIFHQEEIEWGIPPIQNQGFTGFLMDNPRKVEEEKKQIGAWISDFYDFYAELNRLDSGSRLEYGIRKPPADFRFSPKHIIWNERTEEDIRLRSLVECEINRINPLYDKQISEYPRICIPASRISPSS